jgi:SAM-dependent methyltransferase
LAKNGFGVKHFSNASSVEVPCSSKHVGTAGSEPAERGMRVKSRSLRNARRVINRSGSLPYRLRSTPRPEAQRLLELLPLGSTVLDVGAGLGNNAELLLENGHQVVAIEPNEEGLVALRRLQDRYPEQLTLLATTVEETVLTKNFDAVMCSMVLHFLNPEVVESFLKHIRAHTYSGGFHAISWYLAGQNLSPDVYRSLLRPKELGDRYRDWVCLDYREEKQITFNRIRTSKEAIAWTRGRRGYTHARIIVRKP